MDDVYFTVTLYSPDGVQASFPFTIPSAAVVAAFTPGLWLYPSGNYSSPLSTPLSAARGFNYYSSDWYAYVANYLDNNFYWTWYNSFNAHGHTPSHQIAHYQIKPYANGTYIISWNGVQQNFSKASPNGRYYVGGDLTGFGSMSDWRWVMQTGVRWGPGSGWPTLYGTSTWHVGWGYTFPATVTRIYTEVAHANLMGNDAQFQIIGYNSLDDYYYETNGTIMLDITGYSWLIQWYNFTTPAMVPHIKLKTDLETLILATVYGSVSVFQW